MNTREKDVQLWNEIHNYVDATETLMIAVVLGPFLLAGLLVFRLLDKISGPRKTPVTWSVPTVPRVILEGLTEVFEALQTVVLGPIRLVHWLLGRLLRALRPSPKAPAASDDPATTQGTTPRATAARHP